MLILSIFNANSLLGRELLLFLPPSTWKLSSPVRTFSMLPVASSVVLSSSDSPEFGVEKSNQAVCWFGVSVWWIVILLVIWCFIFFSLMRFCYWWLGVSMLIWCWIYVFFTFWNDARCPHWPFCCQLLPPRETLRWDGGSNRMFVANGKPKNPCRGIFDLVLSQEQGISNSIHINWFPSLLEWLPYQSINCNQDVLPNRDIFKKEEPKDVTGCHRPCWETDFKFKTWCDRPFW